MRKFRKLNGIMIDEGPVFNEKETRIKLFKDLIDYDLVNRNTYKSSSTTITAVANYLSVDNVDVLYNDIIKAKKREDLVDILYRMFDIGIEGFRRKKDYNYLNDSNFSFIRESKKKCIEESIDTSLVTMVEKIIYDYYRNIIMSIRENDIELYEKIKLIYLDNQNNIDEVFDCVKDVNDNNLRLFILSSVKDILKAQLIKRGSNNLCDKCPIAYADTCPKVHDSWPKYLEDYDFIIDGTEIIYDDIKEMSYPDTNDNVKELLITNCTLYDKSVKAKYKRLHIFNKN